MREDHQLEQYWFDEPTLHRLGQLVWQYRNVVALCCPMLGQYMDEKGYTPPLVLDIDKRFANERWCLPWDIHRIKPLHGQPQLVICDPPFTNIKLDRLFLAIRAIVGNDLTIPLVMAWPKQKEAALLGTFWPFGLQPTGLIPGYVSCSPGAEFYANFDLRGSLCLGLEDILCPPSCPSR